MKTYWSYSFNRQWHVSFSLKQFMIGVSVEFWNIYILCIGPFSITWIRK